MSKSNSCIRWVPFMFLFTLLIEPIQAQEIKIPEDTYAVYRSLNIDLNGFRGYTIGIELGRRKVCYDCIRKHRKYFGTGFEFGLNRFNKMIYGSRYTIQRGSQDFGIRFTAMLYTTEFEDVNFSFRPEFLIFPTQKRNISAGLCFNYHKNLTKDNNFAQFSIIGMNIRYYILKKRA